MRSLKRIIILFLVLLGLSMFPLGYFDEEVTKFLTINVKYGISLVLIYALYLYCGLPGSKVKGIAGRRGGSKGAPFHVMPG